MNNLNTFIQQIKGRRQSIHYNTLKQGNTTPFTSNNVVNLLIVYELDT